MAEIIEKDAFIRVTFPSGASFCVRPEHSGVVFMADGQWADEELAADMLFLKSVKLARVAPQGSA